MTSKQVDLKDDVVLQSNWFYKLSYRVMSQTILRKYSSISFPSTKLHDLKKLSYLEKSACAEAIYTSYYLPFKNLSQFLKGEFNWSKLENTM